MAEKQKSSEDVNKDSVNSVNSDSDTTANCKVCSNTFDGDCSQNDICGTCEKSTTKGKL